MKHKVLAALITTLATSMAFATNTNDKAKTAPPVSTVVNTGVHTTVNSSSKAKSSSMSASTSTAKGGKGGRGGNATGGNSSSYAGGGLASASPTANGYGGSSQGQTVNVASSRIPVSTAYAAPLTSGIDTCMGSSSGGAQGAGFGLSIGTTWNDAHCRMLKDTLLLNNIGRPKAAFMRMCMDKDLRAALEDSGEACPIKVTPVTSTENIGGKSDRSYMN